MRAGQRRTCAVQRCHPPNLVQRVQDENKKTVPPSHSYSSPLSKRPPVSAFSVRLQRLSTPHARPIDLHAPPPPSPPNRCALWCKYTPAPHAFFTPRSPSPPCRTSTSPPPHHLSPPLPPPSPRLGNTVDLASPTTHTHTDIFTRSLSCKGGLGVCCRCCPLCFSSFTYLFGFTRPARCAASLLLPSWPSSSSSLPVSHPLTLRLA